MQYGCFNMTWEEDRKLPTHLEWPSNIASSWNGVAKIPAFGNTCYVAISSTYHINVRVRR